MQFFAKNCMFSMLFLNLAYFFELLFQCCSKNNFLIFKFSNLLDSKELDRSSLQDWASKTKKEVNLALYFTSELICIFWMQIIFSIKYFYLYSWLSTEERRIYLRTGQNIFFYFIYCILFYTNYLSFNCRYRCRMRAGV